PSFLTRGACHIDTSFFELAFSFVSYSGISSLSWNIPVRCPDPLVDSAYSSSDTATIDHSVPISPFAVSCPPICRLSCVRRWLRLMDAWTPPTPTDAKLMLELCE
ncbi:unnamed protein product, partial [Ectocarpus sp. 8 AP-2014]